MIRLVRVALMSVAFALSLASIAVADAFLDGAEADRRGDYATALKILRPLAEAGDPYAQDFVGIMYEMGHGVAQDYVEAAKWYRLAAAQGFRDGQVGLGTMYADGRGVPQDYRRAYMWLSLAAAISGAGILAWCAAGRLVQIAPGGGLLSERKTRVRGCEGRAGAEIAHHHARICGGSRSLSAGALRLRHVPFEIGGA